jgi:general secretion pathway protein I
MTRAPTHGFTLIEALVALAILAITAVSMLQATEANVARVSALETRAAAGWVAQNRLAEMTLGLPPQADPMPMLGRDYTVQVSTTATTDPALTRVDIAVDPTAGGTGSRLTGFVWSGGQ